MGQQKRLLFVCYGLGIGGIERCLVNLLNILPEDEFDVDLLVLNPEYALKNQIRRKVNFLDAFSKIGQQYQNKYFLYKEDLILF